MWAGVDCALSGDERPMATKKTKKKKLTKSKRSAGKQSAPKKQATAKKRIAKKATSKKKAASRRVAAKKSLPKRSASISKKRASSRTPIGLESESVSTTAFPRVGRGAGTAGQSGDLQGLSGLEGPDSESVAELIEEGNAFEAGVIAGVEDAGGDERELRTREVEEDDVPEEYLDEEQG